MAFIRIQERPGGSNGSNAILSFEHGAEYAISIQDPFSEEQEELLEWYFEQWLRFPFTHQVDAKTAAESIPMYGEKLFSQVFADPEAHTTYREATRAGLNSVQFEIAGSPNFHRWHWEALKDPRLPQPLALQATMVRKNLVPQVLPASIHPSPTINLLIVAARPFGKQDMGYRTISRPLVELLRQANLPVQIEILRPGIYQALATHLREVTARYGVGYYHVIHFDVHGGLLSYEQLLKGQAANRYLYEHPYGRPTLEKYEGRRAFLFLEGAQDNQADPVEAQALAELLLTHQVPITILNACQSGKQVGASETSLGSRLMQAGVQMVLAMGYSVTVSAAERLMRTLYSELFARQELAVAICHGRQELYNQKERRVYFNQRIELEDWLLPVVYQNQVPRLAVRDFTPEERTAHYGRQAARFKASEPRYGFVGRDLDILQIEKRLLTKRNIVLVRGMGGAGKTTLLTHLAAWWQTTGLVEQVFYFGYDEKAWTRQQILVALAEKLLDAVQYVRDFQPQPLDVQQAILSERLRAERHLLILDNLESITGAQLAIQHTLPPEEQQALRGLLADLAGGRTLVLLGSRSEERWLARETFEDNVYDLGGLDPEAASTLAERILERYNVTRYRQDEDLQQLLKLLDGFPLALEVVLANLARQAPKEVLSALQAGDVSLDTGDSQKRTESILRCIDYSHSNLSPEAQQLLLCLAPFTSVLDTGLIEQYTARLKQQPVLATLPFERWQEVLQEAANWGLLSPDPDIPRFLRLQPTLPYFLRSRLYTPEQAEMRRAVEVAFREHYDQVGEELANLLQSKEPQERQLGTVLTGLEYENLITALNMALALNVSHTRPFNALIGYLDERKDYRRELILLQSIVERMEAYSIEQLAGPLGYELASRINALGTQYLVLKQYPESIAAYQKTLQVLLKVTRIGDQRRNLLKAKSYHGLGRVAEEQRQWPQAEQYYQQTLQIYNENNDRYRQAPIYHQLGWVAEEQRQFAQAEHYYQQALQLFIEFNDPHSQAKSYGQLGNMAQQQRQFAQAEHYYQQALQLFIEFNDRYEQAGTYHNLGIVAQQQRQFAQAEHYYQQALQLEIELNDRYSQANTYHQLGRVAEEQRQFTQAEQYFQQALQIYIEFNDRYSQASTYHQLGRVAEEQQRWDKAREHFLRALETYVAYEDSYNGGIALRSLARSWQASGDVGLPAAIAPIVRETPAKVEELLRSLLEQESGKASD